MGTGRRERREQGNFQTAVIPERLLRLAVGEEMHSTVVSSGYLGERMPSEKTYSAVVGGSILKGQYEGSTAQWWVLLLWKEDAHWLDPQLSGGWRYSERKMPYWWLVVLWREEAHW